MAKCRELGHNGGKYDYIVADMADLNSTETVIKVRIKYSKYDRQRDFQQFDILTSVDSDEPVQPPVKLRSSK